MRNITVNKAIADLQDRAHRDADEYAYLYNPKTGKIEGAFEGDRGSVSFSRFEIAEMGGKVILHNHPSLRERGSYTGNRLSNADIQFALEVGLKAIVAINREECSVFIVPPVSSPLRKTIKTRLHRLAVQFEYRDHDRETLDWNVRLNTIPGVFNFTL